jgi:hypothetical protein
MRERNLDHKSRRYTRSIPNAVAVVPDIGGDLERPTSTDVRSCNQGPGNAELIEGDRGASARRAPFRFRDW